MSNAIVMVVGSLHYDIIVEADHLPRMDETAIGTRWYPKFGGKGGNQAVSAIKQGAAARMVGAVGDDSFGHFLREKLRAAGVDDRFVRLAPGVGSGMSVALLDANGDYAATIVSGANLQIDVAALAAPALWKDIGLLILQNEVPEAVNRAAATEARARGLPVLLNAAPFRPLPADLLANVTHLIVNAVEAEGLGTPPVTSLAAASAAARQLSPLAANVIATAGAQGLAAASGQETVSVPAENVRTVSSHGAGDAFIGALAAALLRGATLHVAAQTAARAAARHVAGLPAT